MVKTRQMAQINAINSNSAFSITQDGGVATVDGRQTTVESHVPPHRANFGSPIMSNTVNSSQY